VTPKYWSLPTDGRCSGVNFINILCALSLYESELSSFSLDSFGFVNFCPKNIGEKGASKVLMKLTQVVTYMLFFSMGSINEGK